MLCGEVNPYQSPFYTLVHAIEHGKIVNFFFLGGGGGEGGCQIFN